MAAADTGVGAKKKSWLKRAAIGGGAGVVVLLVGGYVLVPVIASAKAPGIIERAAAEGIAGSVKVKSVSVGWGGPVTVKGVELRDPEGKLVGTFDAESSLGIWKVLGGLSDLGTAKVSGRLDVVRTVSASGVATTNLERALAGKAPAAPKGPKGSGGPTPVPAVSLTLEVGGIDATYTEKNDTGAEVGRAAMKQLKGSVVVSTAGSATAKVQLGAEFGETLDGPMTGSFKSLATVDGFVQSGALAVEKSSVDATIDAKGAPINLVDALAGQGGLLSSALGKSADASLKVKGTLAALDADVRLESPNAVADLGIKSDGVGAESRVRATRKGTLTLKSLAFVEKVPAVASAFSDAGVRITSWPGATVSIDSLDLPTGGESARWSGAKLEVSAMTSGDVVGTITRAGADGAAGTPEALVVRQVTLGVIAKDLVKGVDVIGFTGATIGGQSAGELDLNVQVSELIGADGRLAVASGSVPGKIVGKLEAKSVATGLLAPFVAAANLPLDLQIDVGPTVDVVLNAMTKSSGAGAAGARGSIPPTDITLSVRSANVSMSSALVYDATGLGIAPQGEPSQIVVERSVPLVQRVLTRSAKEGEPPATASGSGRLELVVTNARLPLSGKRIDYSLATASVQVTVSDLTVATPGAGAARPMSVGVERLQLTGAALPQTLSPFGIDGRLLLDGQPMTVKGDARVSGVMEEQELPRLAGLGTRRASGSFTLSGVSGTALQGLLLGGGAGDAMKTVASELVGSGIDVKIDLGNKTSGNTQAVGLTVTGTGLNASLQGELKTNALELGQLDGSTTLTDRLARAILEMAGQKGDAVATARLREPAGISLRVQPLVIPLKAQSFTPDWTAAKSIVTLSAGLSRPAIVDGLMVDGRSLSAGVANFSVNASVPLSVMDTSETRAPGAAALSLTGSMDVVGNDAADVLARLRVSGGSATDGTNPRVNINLTDVSTSRLDEIAGQGGLLPGLLGANATVVATVAKTGPDLTEIGVEVDSPQMTVKNAQLLVSKGAYTAAGPFTVSITATPALVEQRLLGVKPGEAGSLRVGEPVKVSVNVQKLVLSAPGADVGGGPLKPGVFVIDAVAASPRIVLVRPAAGGAGASTTEFTGFTSTLKSTGNASTTGVSFTASVGSVKTNGQVVNDPTVVRGSIENLADVGGRVQSEVAVLNLTATTGRLPTAVVGSLVSGGGKLSELLGDELTADVEARDVSKTGTTGFVSVKLKSPKASMVAGGPVSGGVLDTGAPGATPLRIELSEFKFGAGGELLKIFPIFAEMERAAGEANKAPATITSQGLRVPIDGDLTRMSGTLNVDVGRVDYQFSQTLGTLLDDTVFRGGRGQDQRPIPAFVIDINRGVLRYGSVQQKVVLPVRNFDFQTRGVIDLVAQQIDVVTYIPTLAAAPGLLGNLNKTVGGALGKIVPGFVDKLTSIPIRTSGPLGNPSSGMAGDVVLDEFKDALKPDSLIKGIGDLLGGGGSKPAPPKPR